MSLHGNLKSMARDVLLCLDDSPSLEILEQGDLCEIHQRLHNNLCYWMVQSPRSCCTIRLGSSSQGAKSKNNFTNKGWHCRGKGPDAELGVTICRRRQVAGTKREMGNPETIAEETCYCFENIRYIVGVYGCHYVRWPATKSVVCCFLISIQSLILSAKCTKTRRHCEFTSASEGLQNKPSCIALYANTHTHSCHHAPKISL